VANPGMETADISGLRWLFELPRWEVVIVFGLVIAILVIKYSKRLRDLYHYILLPVALFLKRTWTGRRVRKTWDNFRFRYKEETGLDLRAVTFIWTQSDGAPFPTDNKISIPTMYHNDDAKLCIRAVESVSQLDLIPEKKEWVDPDVFAALHLTMGFVFFMYERPGSLGYYEDKHAKTRLPSARARKFYEIMKRLQRKGQYFTRVFIPQLMYILDRATPRNVGKIETSRRTASLTMYAEWKLLLRKPEERRLWKFEQDNGLKIVLVGGHLLKLLGPEAYASYVASCITKCLQRQVGLIHILGMQGDTDDGTIDAALRISEIFKHLVERRPVYFVEGPRGQGPMRHVCVVLKAVDGRNV